MLKTHVIHIPGEKKAYFSLGESLLSDLSKSNAEQASGGLHKQLGIRGLSLKISEYKKVNFVIESGTQGRELL